MFFDSVKNFIMEDTDYTFCKAKQDGGAILFY